jgi:hypothetical protein
MHRYPTGDLHADRSDLVAPHPHTGVVRLVALRLHTEVGRRHDEYLLQLPQVSEDVVALTQGKDRIADELPGAVIGGSAPSIDVIERNASTGAFVLSIDEVLLDGPATKRVRGRMLEKHERVVTLAVESSHEQLSLARPCIGVLHLPQPCGVEYLSHAY